MTVAGRVWIIAFLVGGPLMWPSVGACGELQTAVFSELGGKVWVLDKDRPLRPAVLKSQVGGQSSVKTGDRSRAEMEFTDRSLVRLGANAVFSFRPGTRELRLDEGAMLLHVPKGVGGTTSIRTAGATAAIMGTTVIVSATRDGGFRLVVLEGVAEVRYADGQRVRCRAGDTTMRSGGGSGGGGKSQIHLEGLVKSSGLLGGFRRQLPSFPLIQAAMEAQADSLAAGSIQETGQTFGATSLEPLGDRDRIRSVPRLEPMKEIQDKRPRNLTGPNY